MANGFAVHRNKTREILAGSMLTGSTLESIYVNGSIPFAWRGLRILLKDQRAASPNYERQLLNFIDMPSRSDLEHPVYLIVGGIGTGKSTALRYSLDRGRTCHQCSPRDACNQTDAFILRLDLLGFGKNDAQAQSAGPHNAPGRPFRRHYQDEPQDDNSRFWCAFEALLSEMVTKQRPRPPAFTPEEEVEALWPYLLQSTFHYCLPSLRRLLLAHRAKLQCPASHIEELSALRTDLYSSMSMKDICYYWLLVLRYLRRDRSGECNLVLLDNVDGLHPINQRQLVDFALEACRLLQARAIITMRPYTLSQNHYATRLTEVVPHMAPDVLEVIRRRIRHMKRDTSPEIRDLGICAEAVINTIAGNPTLATVFMNCHANGVRRGIRNFYNLLLSPLLVTSASECNVALWKTNEFYQAFFCSETADQLLYDDAFSNILVNQVEDGAAYLSTIKIRMLHHLVAAGGDIRLDLLSDEMRHFSYDDSAIASALNDMLRKDVPLLWSDSAIRYERHGLDHTHYLSLAPLGEHMYLSLMYDPMYLRECIFKLKRSRVARFADWSALCTLHLKDLAEQDYREVLHYIDSHRQTNYESIYRPIYCLGRLLWTRYSGRLATISKEYGAPVNQLYEEYIWYRLRNVLSLDFHSGGDG